MSFERIPFPQGNSPQQLYQNQVSVVRELKRIFQDITAGEETDLSEIVSDITQLRTDVDALMADLSDGGLTLQQQFMLSLTTASSDILGSIANVYERVRARWEHDADSAIQAAIEAHKANTGLRTEIRVRQEETLALAEQITNVTADLGVTNASVTTLEQAVADGDSALATQMSAVQSTVAGNTAQIQIVTASVNGVSTRFAVQVNSNNEVVGWIRLDGSVSGSVFTVAASKFQVSELGTTGGTAKPVFAIQPVGGVAQIAFRGTMFADGTIVARHIAAGSITADKISATSLSAITANFGTASFTGIIRGGTSGKLIIDLTNGRIRGLA